MEKDAGGPEDTLENTSPKHARVEAGTRGKNKKVGPGPTNEESVTSTADLECVGNVDRGGRRPVNFAPRCPDTLDTRWVPRCGGRGGVKTEVGKNLHSNRPSHRVVCIVETGWRPFWERRHNS